MVRIKLDVMGVSGKVIAISIGVFAGGALGFYLRETYYLRLKKEKCAEMEKQWREKVEIRKRKQKQLQNTRN